MKIEPKPMSAERRAEIEACVYGRWSGDGAMKEQYLRDLLADSAFWREAVRKTDPALHDSLMAIKED